MWWQPSNEPLIMASQRLALGTAQFGLPYGVANQVGRISRREAERILDYAWSAGLETLDTAIAYGDSEQRLGQIGIERWHVVSKLPAVPESCTDVAGWVEGSVTASLNRLKIKKLRGLLLHRPRQLLRASGHALYAALDALKTQGVVEKIGVSIYDPEELSALWPHFRLDLTQVPFNILDRRFATTGWLVRLKRAGIEVHARSVFLQGLLLMDSANRPSYFQPWQSLWDQWHGWLAENKTSPLYTCLRYALTHPAIDRVIIGVDSLKHLQDNLAVAEETGIEPPAYLQSTDRDLINPSRWQI